MQIQKNRSVFPRSGFFQVAQAGFYSVASGEFSTTKLRGVLRAGTTGAVAAVALVAGAVTLRKRRTTVHSSLSQSRVLLNPDSAAPKLASGKCTCSAANIACARGNHCATVGCDSSMRRQRSSSAPSMRSGKLVVKITFPTVMLSTSARSLFCCAVFSWS